MWGLLDENGEFVGKSKIVQNLVREYAKLKKEVIMLRSTVNAAPSLADPKCAAPQRAYASQPSQTKMVFCPALSELSGERIEVSQEGCDVCSGRNQHHYPNCPRMKKTQIKDEFDDRSGRVDCIMTHNYVLKDTCLLCQQDPNIKHEYHQDFPLLSRQYPNCPLKKKINVAPSSAPLLAARL